MNVIAPTEFREVEVTKLFVDPNQPREDFNTEGDKNRLILSIKDLGIQQPIAVVKINDDEYRIIDGHRRLLCAKEIGMQKVPCRIYENLSAEAVERVRYELQNNRRLWKPTERSTALENFKKASGITTNKEMAEKLFVSETLVSNSLKLETTKKKYKDLMSEYKLTKSYQVEFIKLEPKLRPIREFTIDDIIKTIFERVSHHVIRNSKDFRTLGRIFLRGTANAEQIYDFLSDPDMSVGELEESTSQSGFALWVEQSIKKIKVIEEKGGSFSSQEKLLLYEMQRLLNKYLG